MKKLYYFFAILLFSAFSLSVSANTITFTVNAYQNSSSLGLYTSNGGNQPCANPNSNLAPSGGIQVNAGDVVSGTASGSWTHDPSITPYGPNGFNGQSGDACLPQLGILAMKLVANDGTTTWSPAGSSFNTTISKSGTLYFAFSDSDQTNNSGSVSVSLNINSQNHNPAYCANGTSMTASEILAAKAAGALTVTDTPQSNQLTYHVSNTTGCTAPLIAASDKMFIQQPNPGWLSTQQFYADSGIVNINANGNTDISVAVPSCMSQADLWYQTAPHSYTSDTYAGWTGYTLVAGGPITGTSLCTQNKCVPDWQTSSWSDCSNGWQTRTATDMNKCGDDTDKPICSQSCSGQQNNCIWKGHCQGDPCQTFDDCDGNLVCNSGKCGPIGGGGNPPPTCAPSWQTSSWSDCSNGWQTRTATDMNNCGTDSGKPVCSQSCSTPPQNPIIPGGCIWKGHCAGDSCQTFNDCDGNLVCNSGKCGPIGGGGQTTCTPSWQTGAWSACNGGQQTRTCTDTNNCGTSDGKPETTQTCSSSTGGNTFDQGIMTFTFDNGWESAYQNAIPLLDQYGIRSTNFIITNLVGDTADGYMTSSQLLDLQNRGHEIESETESHTDLTTLTPTQLVGELSGSISNLEALGVNPITSMDYPYGVYSTAVEQAVQSAGYLAARTSDLGYNQAGDSPYLLKAMTVTNTTSVSDIEGWIDYANANKVWLIIVIHQVDNLGNPYDIAPSDLSQVVDYVHQNNIKTVKVSEGLTLMGS